MLARKLTINQLIFLPNRLKTSINSWNHPSISTVGSLILLNNTIFAIPNYMLNVMNLPNSIMDSISKLARVFFCGRSDNSSGFHSVGWLVTTLQKIEGGLGIINLIFVKHTLMAKNIFAILNSENKTWVEIFKGKYKNWHPWANIKPSYSS